MDCVPCNAPVPYGQKMAKKFQNKYRVDTARATWWNYGWDAVYFVTIVTRDRHPWFGQVHDGIMHLSEIGLSAHECWLSIPNHFPFVWLGAHVVMPDHVHGIIAIQKRFLTVREMGNGNLVETQNMVETQYFASLRRRRKNAPKNQFGPQSKNLGSIVRGFKIGVTKEARNLDVDFGWQARYHDRIIRNQRGLKRITKYILDNPQRWPGK